ncbi:MAG: hypothetical protein MUE40_00535 [Anaerolineae bacterium]|jgi:hypothetical protein|nr:hypothetical protein [Anaerolineae bacterium]
MAQVASKTLVNSQMTPTWEHFLRFKVNSFIKWDLVRFFHDNPHTADTVENIAGYIGRDTRTVQRELDALVEADILEATLVSGMMIYRYVTSPDVRHLIADFVGACYNREFRVKAIQYVIHGMSFSPGHDL